MQSWKWSGVVGWACHPGTGNVETDSTWGLPAKPSNLVLKSQFSETLSQNTRWVQATQSYSASTLLQMFCLYTYPSPGLSKHWNHHFFPLSSFTLLAKEEAESEIAYAANDEGTLKKARTPLSSHHIQAPKVPHLNQTQCHLIPS